MISLAGQIITAQRTWLQADLIGMSCGEKSGVIQMIEIDRNQINQIKSNASFHI
jgi:hypothetical protein